MSEQSNQPGGGSLGEHEIGRSLVERRRYRGPKATCDAIESRMKAEGFMLIGATVSTNEHEIILQRIVETTGERTR